MNAASYCPSTWIDTFTVANPNGLLCHYIGQVDLCFWPCPHGRDEILFAEYPTRWNKAAVAGLMESLHAINYRSLAEVVTDLQNE